VGRRKTFLVSVKHVTRPRFVIIALIILPAAGWMDKYALNAVRFTAGLHHRLFAIRNLHRHLDP